MASCGAKGGDWNWAKGGESRSASCRAKSERIQRAKRENALAFARPGISAEKIAQVMNESVSQVQGWIAEGAASGK